MEKHYNEEEFKKFLIEEGINLKLKPKQPWI